MMKQEIAAPALVGLASGAFIGWLIFFAPMEWRHDASDLTKEQKAALQVLGESLPGSAHGRWCTALDAVYAREQVYVDAMNACKPGTAEYREASAKAFSFMEATENIVVEYYRRKKFDGPEAAADWYVTETQKSDTQIIEDWKGQ